MIMFLIKIIMNNNINLKKENNFMILLLIIIINMIHKNLKIINYMLQIVK